MVEYSVPGLRGGGGLLGEQPIEGITAVFDDLIGMAGLFSDIGEKAIFFRFVQDLSAPIVECQYPGIGWRGIQIICTQTQEGAEDHAVDATAGLALGFGGGGDLFQGGFLTGAVHQFAPQTFRAVGQGLKFRIGHGPQPGQDRPFSGG